jgi:hypothetical protein
MAFGRSPFGISDRRLPRPSDLGSFSDLIGPQWQQELDADPLEWWRRRGPMLYPTVALVVLRVFAVSGTSVQDERNASAGGRVMDERRIHVRPGKGEKLI